MTSAWVAPQGKKRASWLRLLIQGSKVLHASASPRISFQNMGIELLLSQTHQWNLSLSGPLPYERASPPRMELDSIDSSAQRPSQTVIEVKWNLYKSNSNWSKVEYISLYKWNLYPIWSGIYILYESNTNIWMERRALIDWFLSSWERLVSYLFDSLAYPTQFFLLPLSRITKI